MSKKKRHFLLVFFISIILSVTTYIYFNYLNKHKDNNRYLSRLEIPLKKKPFVIVNGKKIFVEIANTNQKRTLGLSNRDSLGEYEGMLFTFDKKNTRPTFWMKDMLIPIDIIWINDEVVVEIHENVPPPNPGTPDKNLLLYSPSIEIDYVLEVNTGFSKANNIINGTKIDFSNAGI